MRNLTIKTLLLLGLAALLPAVTGCTKCARIDSQFFQLHLAVHSFCARPAVERDAGSREEILRRIDAFAAELANSPAETRARFQARLVAQRSSLVAAR